MSDGRSARSAPITLSSEADVAMTCHQVRCLSCPRRAHATCKRCRIGYRQGQSVSANTTPAARRLTVEATRDEAMVLAWRRQRAEVTAKADEAVHAAA
jgi:hypothetical protein